MFGLKLSFTTKKKKREKGTETALSPLLQMVDEVYAWSSRVNILFFQINDENMKKIMFFICLFQKIFVHGYMHIKRSALQYTN